MYLVMPFDWLFVLLQGTRKGLVYLYDVRSPASTRTLQHGSVSTGIHVADFAGGSQDVIVVGESKGALAWWDNRNLATPLAIVNVHVLLVPLFVHICTLNLFLTGASLWRT